MIPTVDVYRSADKENCVYYFINFLKQRPNHELIRYLGLDTWLNDLRINDIHTQYFLSKVDAQMKPVLAFNCYRLSLKHFNTNPPLIAPAKGELLVLLQRILWLNYPKCRERSEFYRVLDQADKTYHGFFSLNSPEEYLAYAKTAIELADSL